MTLLNAASVFMHASMNMPSSECEKMRARGTQVATCKPVMCAHVHAVLHTHVLCKSAVRKGCMQHDGRATEQGCPV